MHADNTRTEGRIRRVDVHHHLTPPTLVARAGALLPSVYRGFSPARSLEDMDRAGVDVAVTSIPSPGVWYGDAAEASRLARDCNEHAVRQMADHPHRFGMFATLPLPDIDGSLREIEYALDVLHADGIHMWTSYASKWLGDRLFNPILEELNRRKAVVFTHPTSLVACCGNLVPEIPVAMIEYGTDTCRTIASLVFSGATSRFSDIRFIFSHAGGTMPYLAERFLFQGRQLSPEQSARLPRGVLHELQQLYFDVAQSASPHALSSLMHLVTASKVMLGTDFPVRTAIEHREGLAACQLFSADELYAVEGGNALSLMPHLGRG